MSTMDCAVTELAASGERFQVGARTRGATELLTCDRGTEWMQVVVEDATPHRVRGLLMHPVLVP